MSDDEKTRKVKAVRRAVKRPVFDVATRKVNAVQRRARPAPPQTLGYLPPEALDERLFHFVETNLGLGITSSATTDRYEVQLGDRTPVLNTPRRFSLFPGWRFEVRDQQDALRFTLVLGVHKLVMRKMTVYAPDELEIARFEQRFSMFEVKFDVFDGDGRLLFHIFQASDVHTSYEVRSGEVCVARISKDRGPAVKGLAEMMRFEDAFKVQIESAQLDERDRVILIAAALFMDRVFHTAKNQ